MSLPVVDRTQITGGPGVMIVGGGYFYAAQPIALKTNTKLFDIPSDAYGVIDRRVDDSEFKISTKLLGEWGSLPGLFPYFSTIPGTLIFGTDNPLHVLSLTDDVVTTFSAAQLTKMPDITVGVKE